jgi:hypothetical protein
MKPLIVALAMLALPSTIAAETGSSPVFQVEYTNPGLTPSLWTLTIHPDGSGHFHSERGHTPVDPPRTLETPNVDRDIRLSTEFTARVFATARRHDWSSEGCESHMKVAFQGWKKFVYRGPEGQGTCSFNYSKDKEMQALGDSLVDVAGTILTGARLELLLQHDRLGLDRELEVLTEASHEGRAPQICVIRGILERLAMDESVLERVRRRAKALLQRDRE